MEIHRLSTMKPHDPKLFNSLYSKTERLRKSLVYQIDPSRFGVTQDIVMSWFDDKFLFVFNKYVDQKKPDVLLGYLINSLKVFKMKVLRRSYQDNNTVNLNSISLEDLKVFNITDEVDSDNKELLLNLAFSFLQQRLSEEAYELLQLQLNPPIYILSRIKNPNTKIPANLILDFLGLENTPESIGFINYLRREITNTINDARSYFKSHNIELA